jgi:hypothetical protein
MQESSSSSTIKTNWIRLRLEFLKSLYRTLRYSLWHRYFSLRLNNCITLRALLTLTKIFVTFNLLHIWFSFLYINQVKLIISSSILRKNFRHQIFLRRRIGDLISVIIWISGRTWVWKLTCWFYLFFIIVLYINRLHLQYFVYSLWIILRAAINLKISLHQYKIILKSF